MAALARKFKKIFGKDSSNNGVFGSEAAGSPAVSTNPETIESLPAFSEGWDDATLAGLKLPCLEDMQGLKYDTDYHLAYMYQAGIAEYDNQTEYTTTSIVRQAGTTNLYRSLATLNTGNPLSDGTKWALLGNLANIPASTALLASNNLSDITSSSAARNNLGLGTAATKDTGTSTGQIPLAQDIQVLSGMPSGAVMSFAMSTVPSGWLKCNGSEVSRATYSSLFSAIGTTFGAGDGSTTFKLPDLRGEFIRGWDDGRGVDSGRTFGSSQLDSIQNITGTLGHIEYVVNTVNGAFGLSGSLNGIRSAGQATSSAITFDTSRVVRTSSETRGRNIALMYCIKT